MANIGPEYDQTVARANWDRVRASDRCARALVGIRHPRVERHRPDLEGEARSDERQRRQLQRIVREPALGDVRRKVRNRGGMPAGCDVEEIDTGVGEPPGIADRDVQSVAALQEFRAMQAGGYRYVAAAGIADAPHDRQRKIQPTFLVAAPFIVAVVEDP